MSDQAKLPSILLAFGEAVVLGKPVQLSDVELRLTLESLGEGERAFAKKVFDDLCRDYKLYHDPAGRRWIYTPPTAARAEPEGLQTEEERVNNGGKALAALLGKRAEVQTLPPKQAAELARSLGRQYKEMMESFMRAKGQELAGGGNELIKKEWLDRARLDPDAPVEKQADTSARRRGRPDPSQLPPPPWEANRVGRPVPPRRPIEEEEAERARVADEVRRYWASMDGTGATPQQPGIAGTSVRTPRNSNKAAWSSQELRLLQQNLSTYDPDVAQLFQGLAGTMSRTTGREVKENELVFTVNYGSPMTKNSRQLSVRVDQPVMCLIKITQRLGPSGQMIWDSEVFGMGGIEAGKKFTDVRERKDLFATVVKDANEESTTAKAEELPPSAPPPPEPGQAGKRKRQIIL